jgi:hypothetical protein
MRTFIATVVLLSCASIAVAEDKKYVSKDGKFTIDFGGDEPTTLKQKAGDIELSITTAKQGTLGLVVIYSDLPEDTIKNKKPKEILETSQKALKFKVLDSKDIEFGKDKLPARELTATTDDKEPVRLRITMILADRRLYQLIAAGPKDATESKEADAFFKSFEITK